MWILALLFPQLNVPFTGSVGVATVIASIGIAVAVLGVLEFRKADTTVDPRFPDRSSQLVASGVYRLSRNPMYLGFLLILFGWAWYLMSLLAFLWLPLFVVYMNRFQIQPEERYMVHKFGEEFHAYTARVRRWI
ncbi:isoprenylcysteine carboxylmethyltransferase family protein [Aliidiomarina minuta]|uniref:Isoprenylcysteine carboxylmethyltransferase family protein n=2 Tax=Aliidiomarina minuta TaxID=880057 RepID=A0A432W4V1_9GAMM|nr:isoprenylcysteine carboxylmethyltransferase family protein [Aliidiomarina minuta]